MEKYLCDITFSERVRQRDGVNLIASENYVSPHVLTAVANCFTNKYAEGYPFKRYYSGCRNVDNLELYCQRLWQDVFKTGYHVNVQPHSGTNANLATYLALLNPGDTILSLSLRDGGHLSHGSPANLSGKLYNIVHYGLGEDERIDYDDIEAKIREYHPRLVIAGASAYSREIDFERIRDIIQANCALDTLFMADIAHIAGLVAAGMHQSPFNFADVVTMTTHKTLRGVRGGLIFCRKEFSKAIDSAVFPGMQGGPLMHIIAGKAATAEEALRSDFKDYIAKVIGNSQLMANEFCSLQQPIVSGGTDNHMFTLDLRYTGLTGKQVQEALEECGIYVNKNCVPNDPNPPSLTSGIRIGTAAMTTKGLSERDFITVARKIYDVIRNLSPNQYEMNRESEVSA